ncbi:MAG: alpha-L-rhamnosidase C-terminal domain-containing protein [bacterium]|nr:alpha-L-rhamnosidase C-terminal domain-containing protein [bacterium]
MTQLFVRPRRWTLAVLLSFLCTLTAFAEVNWQAKWIWSEDTPPQQNLLYQARKGIEYQGGEVVLHLTADSRYRLYVNQRWIVDGPNRSFPHRQQYDTVDITPYLQPGKNVIGLEVMHWGLATFQYLAGQPALLCQIESSNSECIGTDASWRIRPHPGHERRTQRIACQQPYEEQLDGRGWDTAWLTPAYDDSTWSNAVELGPVGRQPWTQLEPRDIPFLTREPVHPVRALSAQQVEGPDYTLGVETRFCLGDGNLEANHIALDGVLVTTIESPKAQDLVVLPANSTGVNLFVNGQAYGGFPQWESHTIPLKEGTNLFVAEPGRSTHWTAVTFALDVDEAVTFQSPLPGSAWTAVRFDRNNQDLARAIREAQDWDTIAGLSGIHAASVREDHCSPVVAYNTVWGGHAIPAQPQVTQLENAFSDTPDVAVIAPAEGDTEIVLDFGKEVIGYFNLILDAPEGVVIDVACYEAIEDGVTHWSQGNLCSFRYTTREGWQEFLSRYRRGFRYATLVFRNVTAPIKLQNVNVILATYPDVRKGSFACSDANLNKIWDVGVWTLRMCSEDTFTDCPLYEQTYWVGDGRNEALVSYPVWGSTPLVRRCVLLPGQSLYRSPLTESQVPSGWQNIIPAWSFLWVQMAEEYYFYSGDRATLETVYPDVVTMLTHCMAYCTERGLMRINAWNFFDWAGMDIGHETCTHNSVLLAETAQRAANMARFLGKNEDVAKWEAFRQDLITAVNQAVWDETKGAYVDSIHGDGTLSSQISQQTNALALLYDVVPADKKPGLLRKVASPPDGMVQFGSPFALFYVLEMFAEEGLHDQVLSVVRSRWQPMLDKGATTFWEMFPQEGDRWWTRSHCHAWSAAPTFFLSKYQLGVRPLEPGFTKLAIAPQPVDLTWCEGNYPIPQGTVFVSWKREENAFRIKSHVPAGTTADVVLPLQWTEYPTVTIDGKAVKEGLPAGIQIIHDASKQIKFNIPGGREIEIVASR